jgi:5-oxoprolinase (ATP-hydrolysing)
LERSDGTIVPLPGTVQIEVEAGDILTIKTPGGGGFGV